MTVSKKNRKQSQALYFYSNQDTVDYYWTFDIGLKIIVLFLWSNYNRVQLQTGYPFECREQLFLPNALSK